MHLHLAIRRIDSSERKLQADHGSARHHHAIPLARSCTCTVSSFFTTTRTIACCRSRAHSEERDIYRYIYTHPFSSVHLLQAEGRSRLGVACLASATATGFAAATALPRSSFQGLRSFLATVRVSDRAVLAAAPVRGLHQPYTAPRRANRHRVAHTASSLLSPKAPGGVSMRTEPAAVSKLPGHHTATQGAFAETRHC